MKLFVTSETLLLLFVGVSCATTSTQQKNGASQSQPLSNTVHITTSAEGDQPAAENEISEGLGSEPEGEFCRDDIYSQFLTQEYMRTTPLQSKAKPAPKVKRKSRRGEVVQREIDALYFARSKMIGDTPPYFGAIPVVSHPLVEHWVRYFKTRGRKEFLKWLVRSESVRPVVTPILRREGLPTEFIYLSMIESGFSSVAISSAKATGPWQFIKGTAKLYGLKMDFFVDERRDPIKSTVAAAAMLRDLYQEFGDWYLAMAAYNAGPGRIRSAMRRCASRDFWHLASQNCVPVETKNYVPKMLAALTMASSPTIHGFDFSGNPLDSLPVATVELNRPISMEEMARKLSVNLRDLRYWNPEITGNITPPQRHGQTYPFRLPPQLVETYEKIKNDLSEIEIAQFHIHKIRRGDTLARLANQYKVSVKSIIAVNPTLAPGRIKIGREVAIPVPSIKAKTRT